MEFEDCCNSGVTYIKMYRVNETKALELSDGCELNSLFVLFVIRQDLKINAEAVKTARVVVSDKIFYWTN